MSKILVDTSVWIDALNGKINKQTKKLLSLIEKDISVVICPVIVQEILQGIKDEKQFREVKENLTGFELLNLDSLTAAYGAADLYRSIRKKGITIRKSNDCLIAFYAIHHKARLLHNDKDFVRIAKNSSLSVMMK